MAKGRWASMKIILLAISFSLMMVSLYLVFMYVPTEENMGIVQRIFYFHVPVAWVSFLAFFVVFIGSILYLWKREEKWDILARSSGEIGVVFTSLVLVTGPIWAKPAWGVWWTWDARLTTTLIMWLIYIAYLLVRSFAAEESRGARFAAVVGIVGFVDLPIAAIAIVLWRTQHPSPIIFEGGLAPSMFLTLMVCVATFTILYVYILMHTMSIRKAEVEVEKMAQALRG
jgi:heme exporter protein C